ncbi:MAG: ABC transporter ATP-binding protein [Candidatus Heimdallarchaeota archaeon]
MIDCKDVIKIYTDPNTKLRVAALRGIDLQIQQGEIVSIIGPSGSGKSTLVKVLAGIEAISSGEVCIGDYNLGKMTAEELLEFRFSNIGFVHQFPERTLFLSSTVIDNLNYSASLSSKNHEENRARNLNILVKLGIPHLENRQVRFLSGGEMIRTAIASALAKQVPILICDEPTGQLDSDNTEKVKELLLQVSREFGTTVIVVTHDKNFLRGVDKTCEIQSGRVSSFYSADESSLKKDDYPLEFISQLDSSQNIRIPKAVSQLLQLTKNVKISVTEDAQVTLIHPEGIPPKKIDKKDMYKQKILQITPLTKKYTKKKDVAVKLTKLSKIYQTRSTEVQAVTNIDLTIFTGEMIFIIGKSGSGKSTLIKILTGMEESSSGEVTVLDQQLDLLSDANRARFRRENIGIVSQQGDLHPDITIKDNLFLREILSGERIILDKYPQEKIINILSSFQIEHKESSLPFEISGGELQRASLAIAQFNAPKMLILDEPTANMDSELAEEVMTQLYNIHKQLPVTLIITTHDINLVRDGFRVVQLKDGKIEKDGIAKLLIE